MKDIAYLAENLEEHAKKVGCKIWLVYYLLLVCEKRELGFNRVPHWHHVDVIHRNQVIKDKHQYLHALHWRQEHLRQIHSRLGRSRQRCLHDLFGVVLCLCEGEC